MVEKSICLIKKWKKFELFQPLHTKETKVFN